MSELDLVIKKFNKSFNDDLFIPASEKTFNMDKIPFSSPRLNYMLYGGITIGKLVEFYGEEGGGKTTTALDFVANAQKYFKGTKKIIYADCENTLDEKWAKTLNVDLEDLILMSPTAQTAEQIFEMLLKIIETGEVGLIVIDSLGVLLSAQAYEKTMEEKTYGGISAALTLFSKKAELLCAKTGCILIGINQVREDMNANYRALTTPGGKAWKHNCCLRLMFQKGEFIDAENNILRRSAEAPSGNQVMISIAKTKMCKPDRRTGFYTLNYTTGIDVIVDTVETAITYGIIKKSGSWFGFVDTETGEILFDSNLNELTADAEPFKIQGKNNLIRVLEERVDIFDWLYIEVNNKLLTS